jgi:hypothetical protein
VALVIDALSVVMPNTAVEERFPGGLAAYQRTCSNDTFSTDGGICRVAFSAEADARAFVGELTRHGFAAPWSGQCSDVALVAPHVNLLYPCKWLETGLEAVAAADGRHYSALVVRLRGDDSTRITIPGEWQPGTLHRLTATDIRSDYELVEVRRDGGQRLETYRHRESGRLVHIGRPDGSA